ncbi:MULTISPECIES: TniQ family protein [unclassified Pseudoalteromonas]|uniref:TniQ family protein n=1 Tax=unclassified Pseudoalteromonas TaxID=194690 RepID=UPI000CF66EFD|nr:MULTISPECIES: TniQ family protein [unclassified Pseudoalteromonas]MCO7250091.1 TniQ family protein [Pseudoalteromonas sp. Ps84H-4]
MTIPNFPAPMLNEHLISCLMRYAVLQGPKEYIKVAKRISPAVSILGNNSFWRPVYNDILSLYMPKYYEKIARENTLLNVYSHLAGMDLNELLKQQLKQPELLRLPYEKLEQVHKGWKWCPECAKEDEDKYGFPYWHVEHQFSLKKRCSIHKQLLLSKCNHCDFAWTSILKRAMSVGSCPCCKKIMNAKRNESEIDTWIEKAADGILTGHFELNRQSIQKTFKQRYGIFQAKRFWSVAERKQIFREQQMFNQWLDKLTLSNHLVPLSNNKPQSTRPAFRVSSFVFNNDKITPLVSLLFKRYWEEVLC